MCEDIHSPKLLICQPPAKTATVQHESLAVVVSEQLCATWSVLTRGSDAFSFFFFFLNTPRLFNMQITATSLNPTASFGNQAPLSHHRWRASQLCCRVRWGTNVSVSVRGRERERVAKKGTEWKQWRREKKKGEGRESGPTGHREKCGGSMSASDKGISLPPVGQKERLTMQVLPPPRARA